MITPEEAKLIRAEQEAGRRAVVEDYLDNDEHVLDHSIARMERTPAMRKLKLEGFLVVTDRQLLFASSKEFVRSIEYEDIGAIRVSLRRLTRVVRVQTADGEYRFNVGKTFARSIVHSAGPRI